MSTFTKVSHLYLYRVFLHCGTTTSTIGSSTKSHLSHVSILSVLHFINKPHSFNLNKICNIRYLNINLNYLKTEKTQIKLWWSLKPVWTNDSCSSERGAIVHYKSQQARWSHDSSFINRFIRSWNNMEKLRKNNWSAFMCLICMFQTGFTDCSVREHVSRWALTLRTTSRDDVPQRLSHLWSCNTFTMNTRCQQRGDGQTSTDSRPKIWRE